MNENNNKIKLKIITHDKVVFENEVEELYVQTTEGRIGILPNHVPVVCALDIGCSKVKMKEESKCITTMGGVLQFSENNATILTDIAELDCDIDAVRAKEAMERAQKRMSGLKDKKDILRAQMALAKAMARISAQKKNF